MSLGITFAGKSQRSWLPLQKPTRDPVREAVTLAKELGYQVHSISEHEISIEFCLTGFLELTREGMEVFGEAQTTPCGPGFHKAVVDFIDVLGGRCGLTLTVEDETSYWDWRDFAQLQQEARRRLDACRLQRRSGFTPFGECRLGDWRGRLFDKELP